MYELEYRIYSTGKTRLALSAGRTLEYSKYCSNYVWRQECTQTVKRNGFIIF